jgi:hypothetical protein
LGTACGAGCGGVGFAGSGRVARVFDSGVTAVGAAAGFAGSGPCGVNGLNDGAACALEVEPDGAVCASALADKIAAKAAAAMPAADRLGRDDMDVLLDGVDERDFSYGVGLAGMGQSTAPFT